MSVSEGLFAHTLKVRLVEKGTHSNADEDADFRRTLGGATDVVGKKADDGREARV